MPKIQETGIHPHYVYTLTDPRNKKVFYVGKGSKNRLSQHCKDARKGKVANTAKHDRIISIIESGNEVVETVVRRFRTAKRAYQYEYALIKRIGLTSLTNKKHDKPSDLVCSRDEHGDSGIGPTVKLLEAWVQHGHRICVIGEKSRSLGFERYISARRGVQKCISNYILNNGLDKFFAASKVDDDWLESYGFEV